MSSPEKRKSERLPGRFTVEIREKIARWATSTEDVSTRGCRIALKRSIQQGAVIQLAFDMGPGADPLVVHGQVAWVKKTAPQAAGITFLSTPRQAHQVPHPQEEWIDKLIAARIRQLADTPKSRFGNRDNDVTARLPMPNLA